MTNLNSQQRNKAEFKHNRAKVLDNGNAICHWCGIHQATEADHLLPTDAGGTNAIDNLVPACKPCNARRGQQYGIAKKRETVFYGQTQQSDRKSTRLNSSH